MVSLHGANLLPGPGTLKGTSLPALALCSWGKAHLYLPIPLATSDDEAHMWKPNNDPPTQLLTKLPSATDGECPKGGHGKEESQFAHPEPQKSHRDRRDQDPQKVEVKSMAESTGIFIQNLCKKQYDPPPDCPP